MASTRSAMAGVLFLFTCATAAVAGGADPQPANSAQPPGDPVPPNVVVLMSDDQTQDSMRYMRRTRQLIGDRGATFPTSVTNWPLCCPSRATFLTGQYAHNHGVLGNEPPLGGFDRLDRAETLPVWLQRAGYHTAHIGKYLNGYGSSAVGVPPGWSEWLGSKRSYSFYGYQLLEDGELISYGSTDENPDDPARPRTYSTDVYTDKAVRLIQRRAPKERPFFLSVGYLAPHRNVPERQPGSRCQGAAKPAVRHLGAFEGEPLPPRPSLNEADISDKPVEIAGRAPLGAIEIARATLNYRCRAESLLAIDEGIGRIVEALRASGELNDTLLIYTSDNGFFHGEHRILDGKNSVYEEAIRVPLLMRGPGIPRGASVRDVTINADLAPTILDAAGATPGRRLDGTSLLPFAAHPERARGRELLIEQYSSAGDENGIPGVVYRAVRTTRYVYVKYGNREVELYDLEKDPFQLQNLQGSPGHAKVERALAARLARLRDCAGRSCRTRPLLSLKLPRSVRVRGRSCRRPSHFVTTVRGADDDAVSEVTFWVGRARAGTDVRRPLRRRIRPRFLRKPGPEVRAIVELVDGRELSLQRRVRICH